MARGWAARGWVDAAKERAKAAAASVWMDLRIVRVRIVRIIDTWGRRLVTEILSGETVSEPFQITG
jgi:hypothetical protein